MPDRLEGAGALRCCAILALYNAGLMALQRRCGFEASVVNNGSDGEMAPSEYGSPQCVSVLRSRRVACCSFHSRHSPRRHAPAIKCLCIFDDHL